MHLPSTSLPPYNDWNETRLWILVLGTMIHDTIWFTMILTKHPITLWPATQPWHHPNRDSYASQQCLFDSRQIDSFTIMTLPMLTLLQMTLLQLYNDDSWPWHFFTIYGWLSCLQRMSHCNSWLYVLLNSCLKLYLNLLLPACKICLVQPIPKQSKIPFNLPLHAKHM